MIKKTITGVIIALERLRNGPSGGPKYFATIRTDKGIYTAETATDSAIGYIIEDYKNKTATYQCHITKKGRLIIDYDI